METVKTFIEYILFTIGNYHFRLYNLLLLIVVLLVMRALAKLFRIFVNKTIKTKDWIDEEKTKIFYRIGRLIIIFVGLLLSIRALSLGKVFEQFMGVELISGEHPILVGRVLFGIFILFISVMLIRLTVVLLKVSIRKHGTIDQGREFSIIRLYKYFAYIVAVVIALYLAGVNLRGLFIGSAALLVGIGFAIQNLFNDFFSGLILLFEDSFDVGDIIYMDGEIVQVKRIDLRTSTVQKRDGNLLSIPNRLLTDDKITNWSHGTPEVRLEIKVGVAYGSDLEQVKAILYQSAISQPKVSKNKPIKILFDDFGDSGLQFTLLFWIRSTWEYRELLSDIRYSIDAKFRESNIEIPFPQRDIRFRNSIPKLD